MFSWGTRSNVIGLKAVLGSVYRWNAHAKARNRSQGKEGGAPFGRAKQATTDAAMRAISGLPVNTLQIRGCPEKGRSPRCAPCEYVSIRGGARLASGPSRGNACAFHR